MTRLEYLEIVWRALQDADMTGDLVELYRNEASDPEDVNKFNRWAALANAVDTLKEQEEQA